MSKDTGMISNSLESNPAAFRTPEPNRMPMDPNTAAFLNGVKTQQQIGADQRAENRNIEMERQAHAQANSDVRAAAELMGISHEEAAHLLRSKTQMIIDILRNPNIKLGRTR